MHLKVDTTAFIAMDFQPSILTTLSSPDVVVKKVSEALTATRAAGARSFFVRVAFTEEEINGFPPHSAMGQRMKALGEKVLASAETTQIDARLSPRADEVVIRKRRVGPFSTTSLHQHLNAAGIETLVLAGTHTSGCVLTAVREAFDLDYRLIVLSDACADVDDGVHQLLMEKIFPKQATVITVDQYVQLLTADGGPR